MQRYICDTNFVIRYLIADNATMFEQTRIIFDKARNGEVEIILLEAVFTEIIFVLSSFYKVPRDKIANVLSNLISYKGIIADKEMILSALQLYKDTNLHVVDCFLATIACNKQLPLLSFDKELNNFVQIKTS